MEAVDSFISELRSLNECKLPVSRQKIGLITKSAIRAIRLYKHVVQAVERYIAKCQPQYKIAGLYALDAIVRQSLHQFCEKDVFVSRFTRQLPATIQNVVNHCHDVPHEKQALIRVLTLWKNGSIFDINLVESLLRFVDDPHPNSPYLTTAQNIADHLTTKQLENKGQGVSTSQHAHVSSKSISSLPGPPIYERETANASSCLSESMMGTESNEYSEPPVSTETLIHTVKMLLQRMGRENLGWEEDFEMLHKSVIDQVRLISMNNTLTDSELYELSEILSQLAECTNSRAVACLKEAENAASVVQTRQKEKLAARRLLDDFDYDDEEDDDVDVSSVIREKEKAENEFKKAQWFANNLEEICLTLTQARKKQRNSTEPAEATEAGRTQYSSTGGKEASPSPWPTSNSSAAAPPTTFPIKSESSPFAVHPPLLAGSNDQRMHSIPPANESISKPEVFDYRHHHHQYYDHRSSGSSSIEGSKQRNRSFSQELAMNKDQMQDRKRRGLPPIKPDRVSVLSLTVFIGRLHKLIDENKLRQVVEEIGPIAHLQHIPPRGCAFVTFMKRKHAAKAVSRLHKHRLDGRNIRVEWAPNKGISEDLELKQYWNERDGCSYIPEKKLPIQELERVLEGGAELDEESISESLAESLKQVALFREKRQLAEQANADIPKRLSLLPTPAMPTGSIAMSPVMFYPPPPPPAQPSVPFPNRPVSVPPPPPPPSFSPNHRVPGPVSFSSFYLPPPPPPPQ